MISSEKITLATLREIKAAGGHFSALTCYDVATARIMDRAGVEVLLVGDTAGEVVLGLPSTRDVPPEFLLTLTAAVRRGAQRALLMSDLPYRCRTAGDAEAVTWARRFFEEPGAECVKVEVTPDQAPLVEAMARAGVPVIAHLGLLPQLIAPGEPYSARGRDAQSARELITAAKAMEEAGAAGLLLEAVPSEVAQEITTHAKIPVIGCVAGPHCDGTVVVLHDLIGWGGGHPPKAVKQYVNLAEVLGRAFEAYVAGVQAGRFPTEQDAIHMKAGEFEKLMAGAGPG